MIQNQNNKHNLEERTLEFSRHLITFLKKIPSTQILAPLVNQSLRSGTSIGANYREANGASSKKDFINKTYICKKESKETMYWLELIGQTIDGEELKRECRFLWRESNV